MARRSSYRSNTVQPRESGMDLTQDLQEGLENLNPMGGFGPHIDVPLSNQRRSGRRRQSRQERRSQERVSLGLGPFSVSAAGKDTGDIIERANRGAVSLFGRLKGIASIWDMAKDAVKQVVGMKCSVAEYEQKKRIDKEYKVTAEQQDPEQHESDPEQPEQKKTWMERFRAKHPKPSLLCLPDPLGYILACCPLGYFEPMLFLLLSAFGALAFSRVRAKYLDGNLHAPNLLVIVEGNWGQGKAKFGQVFKRLFKRVIESDQKKLFEQNGNQATTVKQKKIIQNVGVSVTRSKLFDVLAGNGGVHIFDFEPEIVAVNKAMKEKNGLTTEHYCKAFDNDPVYQNNKAKDSVKGLFPVFMNVFYTGTPDAVAAFTHGNLQGGMVSRYIFSLIPDSGDQLTSVELAEDGLLDQIRDRIDDWRKLYCYTQDASGNDIPCPETIVDLDYVNKALRKWLDDQVPIYKADGNLARKDARARIAAIAFHAGIVLHMLADEPGKDNPDARNQVVGLVLYIADYVMERYLHKFADEQNYLREKSQQAEVVMEKTGTEAAPSVTPSPSKKPGPADAPRLKQEHDAGAGWDKIGEKYGCSGTWIKKLVRKYEERLKRRSGGSESK